MQTFRTMPTFTDLYGNDDGTTNPRAIRLVLCDTHQFMTYADDCEHGETHEYVQYGVIGTDYGKLHNTSGGWRLWNSPSSAYSAAREYREYYN